MRKVLGILLTGALVVGLATVAVAQEKPEGDTADARKRSGEINKRGRHPRFRVLHSDGVAMKKDGTTVDVRRQGGTIETVTADSITLKSRDGYTQTYAVNDETVVKDKRQPSEIGELEAGDNVRVAAVKVGDGYTAKLIHGMPEPKAAA